MDEENFDEKDSSGTPEDRTSPKMYGTPEYPTSPKMNGTPEDRTSPKMDGTPYDPTSPKMDGTPEDPTSPEVDGTPEDPTSLKMDGTPEDPTSPKMDGTPYDPTSPKMDGTPEDPTSPEVDGTPEDPTSPKMDRTPEDPTSPEVDGTPEDPTSPKMDGTPEDPTSPEVDGTPEDPTSPKMDGTPEDPTSPEMDGTPEDPMSAENQDPEKESRVEVMKWPGWPGENIFRILIPTGKIGGIIGWKGEHIKKMCEETKAHINILDVPSCIKEAVVLVSAKEEPSLTLSPAMKGLLAVHACIVDLTSDQPQPGIVSTRLLVAAAQTRSIIGKQGGIIKSIQDESDCRIRVLEENLPIFALEGDKVVDILGKPQNVHKAVELIITHLRKFLSDRSIVQVMEKQIKMLIDQADQNMPSHSGEPPQVFPNDGAGPGYMPSIPKRKPPPHQYSNYYPPANMPDNKPPPHQYGNYYPPANMPGNKPPPHQYSNYYPPADMPDNKPQWGLSYGRDGLMGVSTPSAQPQQSSIGKTMQFHISYADAIIGNSGATITYIRRASGAKITVQEMDSRMNIEINGSASQVQAAQQLIQNVIAGGQIPSAEAPPTGQASAGFPSYSRAYKSSSGSNAGFPPADYGYGTNNKSG